MKQVLFLAVMMLLIISAAQSQTKTEEKKVLPAKITKQAPTAPRTAPPPPPAPTNKTTGTSNATVPVYVLSSARVSIRTGADNKEFPSTVAVTLMAQSDPVNWRTYIQNQLGNEMRINSDTEFGLDVAGQPLSLETFQKTGLILRIHYNPNIIFDAWKIESVSLILEFKDQNGNLHSTLGRKTIVFSNAYGFLNNEFRYMKCYADASFSPSTAVISKTY